MVTFNDDVINYKLNFELEFPFKIYLYIMLSYYYRKKFRVFNSSDIGNASIKYSIVNMQHHTGNVVYNMP